MSNKIIKFAGFDPSLRNFGIVTGSLNLDTAEVTDVSIKLIETEATSAKKLFEPIATICVEQTKSGAALSPSLIA
ncbi:hypothetical protein LNO78_28810 [Klebsiella pneumoniae subsp. pneumoniae]|jgi:hypothetical protein|nr:hypothetical protein [Klebsiella pneumoniae subsp. pneumoniae]